jgi:hypothetical protein
MNEKHKKITIRVLLVIPILLLLFYLDQSIFPQRESTEKLIEYHEIFLKNGYKYNSSKELVGYKYFTKKGLEFSIKKEFVEENDVNIKSSYIFKTVTSVKSSKRDYSDKLMSGMTGLTMFLYQGLTISSIISLLALIFYKKLSKNGFQNIIIMNSFLALIIIYFYFVYN